MKRSPSTLDAKPVARASARLRLAKCYGGQVDFGRQAAALAIVQPSIEARLEQHSCSTRVWVEAERVRANVKASGSQEAKTKAVPLLCYFCFVLHNWR